MSRKCTTAEGEMLLEGCCPLCHEYLLRRGAEGGISINVRCDKCEAVWNIGVGSGMCELLEEAREIEQEQTEDTEQVLVEKDVSSSEGGACGLSMKDQTNIQCSPEVTTGQPSTYPPAEEGLGDGSGEGRTPAEALSPFRMMMRAQREEVKGAKEGLHRLVTCALENRFCSTAYIIRSVLLSLYNSRPCDLAAVQQLDTVQRRALGALVLGMGIDGGVYDHEIRDAFALEGSVNGLTWFLKPLRPSKDFVQGCLHSALGRASGAHSTGSGSSRKVVVV